MNLSKHGIKVSHAAGDHKVLCPKCSHLRKHKSDKCLSVTIDDRGAVWQCHNDGCNFKGAEFRDSQAWTPPKKYIRPQFVPAKNDFALPQKVQDFFVGRSIPLSIVRDMKIFVEDGAICFPYFRDDELVNVKYRYPGKRFKMVKDAELCFYNLDGLLNKKTGAFADKCYIVEGEIDALSLMAAGYTNVISVPNGAQSSVDKDREIPWLESAHGILESMQVILAVDSDAPGQKLEAELARRLGPERVCRTRWPAGCKDANDVLVQFGADTLREAIDDARPMPVRGVYEAYDVKSEVGSLYTFGIAPGIPTGWTAFQDGGEEIFRLKSGCVTCITGAPFSGKSAFAEQLVINTAKQEGWRWGVISPEHAPMSNQVALLLEKYTGKSFHAGLHNRMSKDEMDDAFDFLHRFIFFICADQTNDTATVDFVLEKTRVLIRRYGINALLIDPWNSLDHPVTQNMREDQYLQRMLNQINHFAKSNDLHVVIVAHPTKLQKDQKTGTYPVAAPYDIEGGRHWFGKMDNILSVWRDFTKPETPTHVYVQKVKQRHSGKAGKALLRYDRDSGCLVDLEPSERDFWMGREPQKPVRQWNNN